MPIALMATKTPAVSMNAMPMVSVVKASRMGDRNSPSMPVKAR